MRILLASLFSLLLAGVIVAKEPCFPPRPADTRYHVYQFVDLLSAQEKNALDEKLQRFSLETSNQIVVVIVGDLCDEGPAIFGQLILEKWGIGQKDKDNGVVVLVKPTETNGRRELFIATGYGLEGAIPDATCKQIVEDEILPAFKQGRYAEGLEQGTNTLMALAKGEVNAAQYNNNNNNNTDKFKLIGPLAVALVFLLVMLIKRGQVKRYAQRNRIGFWAAWALLNAATRSHGGSWGGFSGGGGGGWSGGGGFGGGSGGGGGAGGSW